MPDDPRVELETICNNLVLANNEIDLVITFDTNGGILVSNTKYDDSGKRPDVKELQENAVNISASLTNIKSIAEVLVEFGQESGRGQLNYSVFQLGKGILIVHFLGKDNIAFISSTKDGLPLMLRAIDREITNIERLIKLL